jgi:hypothetical protein
MILVRCLLIATLALCAAAPLVRAEPPPKAPKAGHGGFSWENAIIHIEISGKEYSYVQPWARAERKVVKTGVLLPNHVIITTADGLNDQTLIRLQKQGGGLFSLGRLMWIDYQSNLAALTTDETGFWSGLTPATLADPVPDTGEVHVLRWNDDRLESRPGDIDRMAVDNSALSFVSVPVLKVDSTISGAGSAEAVTMGNTLLGLASSQDNDVVTAVPSSFISFTVDSRRNGTFNGLGYFDFTWEPVQNPLSLQYLGLPGPARGVIVKDTGLKPGVVSPIHSRDVILQIDGFNIDAEGDYNDPQYGKIMLENLSSRQKWAGADCKIKVWRDGKEQMIDYKLPRAEYSDELVPEQSFDHPPDYVLTGGFVFVKLSDAFLRSWGASWRQRAPFRLGYYENDKVKPGRSEIIVLSGVMPAHVNLGYEMLHDAVVTEVNGVKIGKMTDLVEALKKPVNGFDVFRFAPGESTEMAVLDASQIDQTNQEIMTRFHIPSDQVINETNQTAASQR